MHQKPAFPVSECLDGLVVDYLVDGVVPADGASCPFVDGLTTDPEIGDHLFGYPAWWVRPWLEEVLIAEGTDEDTARCMADELDGIDHRVITHLLLGVRSTEACRLGDLGRGGVWTVTVGSARRAEGAVPGGRSPRRPLVGAQRHTAGSCWWPV